MGTGVSANVSGKSRALHTSLRVGIPLLVLAIIARKRIAVDTTQSVTIDVPAEDIWSMASDLENNWEPSNPEHDGTWVIGEPKQPVYDGMRFFQREQVGGVTGELDGVVYDVETNRRFSWRADTIYTLWGLRVQIEEGGTFRIEPTTQDDGMLVSHRVYGEFPDTIFGRALGWNLVNVFDMDVAAARHTRVELEYFKAKLENSRFE